MRSSCSTGRPASTPAPTACRRTARRRADAGRRRPRSRHRPDSARLNELGGGRYGHGRPRSPLRGRVGLRRLRWRAADPADGAVRRRPRLAARRAWCWRSVLAVVRGETAPLPVDLVWSVLCRDRRRRRDQRALPRPRRRADGHRRAGDRGHGGAHPGRRRHRARGRPAAARRWSGSRWRSWPWCSSRASSDASERPVRACACPARGRRHRRCSASSSPRSATATRSGRWSSSARRGGPDRRRSCW